MPIFQDNHIIDANKMADSIFTHSPVEQQEMLEAIKKRIFLLNKIHLRKLGK